MEIFAVVAAILLAACCGVLSIALSQSRRHIAERTAELEAEHTRLAEENARTVTLTEQLRSKELELISVRKDAEALRGRLEEESEKLKEKNEMLMLQFEKTANDIFERKTRQLRDTNKESLDIILKPLKDNISDFKNRVEEIYSKETEGRGALKSELNRLMELNRRITEETNNLTSALRGNSKIQGDWEKWFSTPYSKAPTFRKASITPLNQTSRMPKATIFAPMS